MALLEAHGLVKQYGKRLVVNGVHIQVDAGEIVGLLGPNGAGKSTSFRMIVGMIQPKAGEVLFNGQVITRLPMFQRARLGMGYLAQDSSVFRKLTVEQNLFSILEMMTVSRGKPFHMNRKQRRQRVDELLDQFGLQPRRKNLSVTLSGGERRRLEIARCLLSDPLLIMLDEPFTGIDPKTLGDIQEIIRDLRDQGIGVLITDHHVAETLRITDRSYLIAGGTMLTHGTPTEILNDARAREVYLGDHFEAPIGENPCGEDRQPKMPAKPSLMSLLESESMFDWVYQLTGPDWSRAAYKLQQRGPDASRALLHGMESNDPLLRQRAFEVLQQIDQRDWTFQADADAATRSHQLTTMRDLLLRKAG